MSVSQEPLMVVRTNDPFWRDRITREQRALFQEAAVVLVVFGDGRALLAKNRFGPAGYVTDDGTQPPNEKAPDWETRTKQPPPDVTTDTLLVAEGKGAWADDRGWHQRASFVMEVDGATRVRVTKNAYGRTGRVDAGRPPKPVPAVTVNNCPVWRFSADEVVIQTDAGRLAINGGRVYLTRRELRALLAVLDDGGGDDAE